MRQLRRLPHVPCAVSPRLLTCGLLMAGSGGAGAELNEAWRWWQFSSSTAKLALGAAVAHVAFAFSHKKIATTCIVAVLNILVAGATCYWCASLPAGLLSLRCRLAAALMEGRFRGAHGSAWQQVPCWLSVLQLQLRP